MRERSRIRPRPPRAPVRPGAWRLAGGRLRKRGSALVVAAAEALLAALLVDERRLAALLADVARHELRGGRRRVRPSTLSWPRCSARTRASRRAARAPAAGRSRAAGRRRSPRAGDDLLEPPLGRHRRRHAEGQGDQPPQRLGDRHGVGPGLADLDEDLEGLAVAVLVDDGEGRADRRLDAVRPAREAVRARLDDRRRRGRRGLAALVAAPAFVPMLSTSSLQPSRNTVMPRQPSSQASR